MAKVTHLVMMLLLVAMAWAGVSVAYAHAELREASPEIGAVYRWNRPNEIRLSFTQEVELEGSSITLTNRNFELQSIGQLQIDPEDNTTLVVDILADPFLSVGTYTVNWKTASVDGHTIQGSYDFTLLHREAVITSVVAPIVLVLMGVFVWYKRAR
jgi:methionine-rich copper-binding protein CopC